MLDDLRAAPPTCVATNGMNFTRFSQISPRTERGSYNCRVPWIMKTHYRTLIALTATLALAIAQPPPGGALGDGIWLRNAFFGEAQTFDACGGHQPGNGQYHHHAAPNCLREQLNDNIERVRNLRTGPVFREKSAPWSHSPILGWAFDGYPIYGPYAFSDPKDPQSEVLRMRSGYRLRTITERKTLPDWALPFHTNASKELTATQFGPPINATFPLGRYLEDFEQADSHGDLDQFNGRFAVTPEYPQGTYAYHVTIEADGTPAFPYILAGQFRGMVSGGAAQTVPTAATDASAAAEGVALLSSWATRNAGEDARVSLGFDPSAGGKTIWPFDVPSGARIAGSVASPAKADIQRLRASDTDVYVNANGLASYVMGPWFDALQPGGVFGSVPTVQALQVRFPRNPVEAATKRNTALGAQGIWVNGVAVFNTLDGASYSLARATDVGGGIVGLAALHVPAASLELGPLVAGSVVAARPLFSLRFPNPVQSVTITDAAGTKHTAEILSATEDRVDYRLPSAVSIGYGSVAISGGSVTITGNINVRESYVNLDEAASKSIAEVTGLSLSLRGSGVGNATDITATVNGIAAQVLSVESAGGTDSIKVTVPSELAVPGWVEVVVRAGGKTSNTIWVEIL